MVLDDLAIFLQTQGLGTRGTNILEGRLPPDPPGAAVPDELIVLFAVPSPGPDHVHDIVGPALVRPVVQVRWRGRATQGGYAALWTKAEAAFVALDSVRNQVINGVKYLNIMALQSPNGAIPDDQYNRPTLVFSVICHKEL